MLGIAHVKNLREAGPHASQRSEISTILKTLSVR